MWDYKKIAELRRDGCADEEYQLLVTIAEHAIRAYERYSNPGEPHNKGSYPPRWQIGWAMGDDLRQALEQTK